ncbi:M20/M25/M40 family metallo-hydrolase [Pseudomonas sp. F1_0610]|uniref:M20/M25/M40 family metallo-hydrolase n=1 Tax=Pseudomonas sp. F1_0610 TaxID=3114284 RepID=UPI0039C01359
MMIKQRLLPLSLAVTLFASTSLWASPQTTVHQLATQEQEPLLNTLKALVHYESGSKDPEGLQAIAQYIAKQLSELGATVTIIQPTEKDTVRLADTPEKLGPMVQAELHGKGTRNIMLIAHMDTVYLPGMLKDQPFKVEGNHAYGLGIADNKQGVASIIHTVALLQKLKFEDYGKLTILINGDEEISSPASRNLLTRLAKDQDAVFSFEGGMVGDASLLLATSGIGAAYLKVQGKASHAGAKPEDGINALYELAHQILQMKDLSQPEQGVKLNWTVAQAGTNRNVIPAQASAQGDARALRTEDFKALQSTMQNKVQQRLLTDTKVDLTFEVRRPPFEATDAAIRMANHAQSIYKNELNRPLIIQEKAIGGGTDAAFAGLETRGVVIEGFGINGFGAHSNSAEYVLIDSITPSLYLNVRMIMDIAHNKVP